MNNDEKLQGEVTSGKKKAKFCKNGFYLNNS